MKDLPTIGQQQLTYLQLTLEEYLVDGDLPFFLKGLQTFVESQGGVSEFSKRARIKPNLFRGTKANAPLLDAQDHTEHA